MWHSMDLLHWEPLYEIPYPMGGASELCKVGDTYYIYNIHPYRRDEEDYQSSSVWALTTADIRSANWDGPVLCRPGLQPRERPGTGGPRPHRGLRR